jgi:hypothetical protein
MVFLNFLTCCLKDQNKYTLLITESAFQSPETEKQLGKLSIKIKHRLHKKKCFIRFLGAQNNLHKKVRSKEGAVIVS